MDNASGSFGSVVAGATTVITFPGIVHLNANAPTSCQNILFTIPVSGDWTTV